MSDAAVSIVEAELDDELELEWRTGPPLLPLLAAVGGASVIGIAAGVALALLVGLFAGESEPVDVEPVPVTHDLGVVNVNLRGGEGERILSVRAQVDVMTTDEARVEALVPVLRDGVLVLASDHTAEELLVHTGRSRFRDELHQRFDLLLDGDTVTRIYFTELVVK